MRTWIDVAVLAKSKNLDGRFVANAAAGLPFILEAGDTVSLVPPKLDIPRTVTVKDVSAIDAARARVSFEEVDDAATASQMVGMHCLVKREALSDEVFVEAPALWDGWPVVDEKLGYIGDACGVIENPAQDLLEVSTKGSSVLVPIVDEIVLGVDVSNERIMVDLPNGLLDL